MIGRTGACDQRSREVLGHARDGQREREGQFWSYSNGLFVNTDSRLLRSDGFLLSRRRGEDRYRYPTEAAAATGALEKLLGRNRYGE